MPSFFIRNRSVFGMQAQPLGRVPSPLIRQPHSRSTASMCARCTASSVSDRADRVGRRR